MSALVSVGGRMTCSAANSESSAISRQRPADWLGAGSQSGCNPRPLRQLSPHSFAAPPGDTLPMEAPPELGLLTPGESSEAEAVLAAGNCTPADSDSITSSSSSRQVGRPPKDHSAVCVDLPKESLVSSPRHSWHCSAIPAAG